MLKAEDGRLLELRVSAGGKRVLIGGVLDIEGDAGAVDGKPPRIEDGTLLVLTPCPGGETVLAGGTLDT